MWKIKNDPSKSLEQLSESQARTYDAVRDLDETLVTKLDEAFAKIDRLVETTTNLLEDTKTIGVTQASLSGRNFKLLDDARKILTRVDEISERQTRPPKPMEREEWIPIVTEKMDKIFQKLQKHRETPVYSYLVEQRASSLVAMELKKIAELPHAQLRSLDAICDNVLEAMEYCE